MKQFSILLVLSLGFVSLFSGCAEKVDCKKMKARLTQCMDETYAEVNPNGRPLKDPRFKKDANEISAKYISIIDKHYYDECVAIGGREKRAKKINKCLAKKSCQDVHGCLKFYLK